MRDLAPSASVKKASSRILGIDVARAIAMLGMVIVHYVPSDGSRSIIDALATLPSGRSISLFVVLGGVGASMLAARSNTPDRDLLFRAAILLPLGFILQELTTWIAIILQAYALFFLLAPIFRRWSDRALLWSAVVVAIAGTWTYQVIAPALPGYESVGELLRNPPTLAWSLLFNGYYPFFPIASFFLFGMWVGRLDLRSERVARLLAGAGTALGLGAALLAVGLVKVFAIDTATFEAEAESSFNLARILDVSAHSEMLAWIISAAGSSVAVLGIALLVTPRLAALQIPFAALGQLALTFYAFQAVLVRVVPDPDTVSIGRNFATVGVMYFGFMSFAVFWKRRFRVGPLEALLRLRSGSKRTVGS